MNKKKRLKSICLILVIFVLAYVTYVSFDICLYGNKDETVKADVAIVLGAAVSGDKPTPVFEERIKHAIWLYKNKTVNKIILTGGKGSNNQHSDSFIARQYAVENAVPFEDIFIEEQSVITQENIFYASKIMQDNHMKTALIVSDPLHMKRAMLMAKDNHLTAYSSPTPSTQYRTLKTKIPFGAREVFFYIGYQIARWF